jgi:hypothetical protein
MVIWDNPGARAEFPRALPGVLAFKSMLPGLSTARLYELGTNETKKEIVMTWKIAFIEAELSRREEARRILRADGGV